MNLEYSIIIPIYNRPKEIDELLESLTKQTNKISFEVIIVEDGSTNTCKSVVKKYSKRLEIRHFLTKKQGAGKSRNFGIKQAKANYFIILDSDTIVPKKYLYEVKKALKIKYTDAFGGPDAAHKNFTNIQKAINYSMTSFLTTGGIRGNKKKIDKFQPRSFNMGISKKAFLKTKGFLNLKTGEDIDLVFRLWKNGFETQLITNAFVYHKRKTSLIKFYKQTYEFGKARPILNKKYSEKNKVIYWFPSIFFIGFLVSVIYSFFSVLKGIYLYLLYTILIAVNSTIQNKSKTVGFLSVLTTGIQFFGYGTGFLISFLKLKNNLITKKVPPKRD